MWQHHDRRIRSCQLRCVDHVDLALPDRHQTHVRKSQNKWNPTVAIQSHHQRSSTWHVASSDGRKIVGSWPTIIARSWPSIGLHRIGRSAKIVAISLIKRCSSSFYLNSWLNHEGIKRFLRKILSSSWSPCVWNWLRSNWCGIDHESSRDLIKFSPWTPESMPKKESIKYTSIDAIWSPILMSIGLVLWIDHSSCDNCNLD